MRQRQFLSAALLGLTLMGGTAGTRGQAAPAAPVPVSARVADLGQDIGKTVTVKGRTGYIVTRYESQGMHVFTLRDDYNGQVMVRTIGDTYPIMGATYRVTGSPTRIGGNIFLDSAPDLIAPLYPATAPVTLPVPPAPAPSLRSQVQLWTPTLLSVLAILLVLVFALLQRLGRPPSEWGVLSVTSGPDRGLTVPLRRRRIALGRGVSPAQDIRLSGGDETISNRHALLEHRNGQLYICDMSSNGTRIGGERLTPDKPVRVNSGDLIHLGTRGTVVIVRLRTAPPAPRLLGGLREASPLADKTLMLSETSADEPAWKNVLTDVHAPTGPTVDAGHAPAARPSPTPPEEDDEDEEDIPHTLAPPMVFTFAGHPPKRGRALTDDAPEQPHGEADGTE